MSIAISEKQMEDYICEHTEEFRNLLKELGFENPVFVGRQVTAGERNRLDLLFYSDTQKDGCPVPSREFIVVELKAREIELADIDQVSRYMGALEAKIASSDFYNGHEHSMSGVLVGERLTKEAFRVLALHNSIYFVQYAAECRCSFRAFPALPLTLTEQECKKIKLDPRIDALYEEREQEEQNDTRI